MEERLREQLPARQLVVTPVERDVDILLKLVVVDPVEVFTAFVATCEKARATSCRLSDLSGALLGFTGFPSLRAKK